MKISETKEINFRELFEAAPGLFLVLRPDSPRFTILGASDAYLNATKTKRNEIVGRSLFEVFPDNPDDSQASGVSNLSKSLERVIEKKLPDGMAMQKYDIPLPTAEGGGFEERYWSPLNVPVTKDSKLIYIIHRVEDVTELHKKSLQIKSNGERINEILDTLLRYTIMDFSQKIKVGKYGDELDAIAVGLNTLSEELENHIKQVETANIQLESVNKELEAFSYSVSHDLRAPLRAINGYSQIIEDEYSTILNDEGKRLLGIIQHNAKKMGALIDDLLAFSRLGKKGIQKTNVDMKRLVEGILPEIDKIIKHSAELDIGQLHPALADYSLISHVFVNLISNAIKYSSKKEKPVVIIRSEKRNGEIIYSVNDNGAGFDMQYVHKLFGVFQRLHTMTEFEGTGVGLAIVQRIINKHEGRVWAEGQINKGATFYFSIPSI
jgi:signal transduction histidine kinase